MTHFKTYRSGLLLVLLLSLASSSNAQRATISDTDGAYLTQSNAIQGADGITGYYFLTRVAKTKMVRKGNRRKETTVYVSRLTLMDQSLNVIGTKDYKAGDDIEVLDVAYNGTYLGVKMIDHEKERKWISVLDAEGNEVRRGSLKYGTLDNPKYAAAMAAFFDVGLAPLKEGFMDISLETAGKSAMSKSAYHAKYVPNDPEGKGFMIRSARNSPDYESANFLAANDSLIVITILKRPNMLSQKFNTEIKAYHTQTGEMVWEQEFTDDAMPVRWFSASFQGDELVVGGMDVGRNGKLMTDIPDGLNFLRLNAEGEITERKRVELASALSQHVKVRAGGAVDGMGNIFIHDMGLTEEGYIQVACEFYKTFNGGVTAKDGLVLHLDPAFALTDITVLEKGRTVDSRGILLTLKGGVNLGKKGSVAALGAVRGIFDHAYTHQTPAGVTSVYFSGNSEKRKEGKYSVHVASLLDGEVTRDKLEMSASSDEVRVYPAKDGYVMVVEYDKDTRSLDIHMERLRI